MNPPLPPGTQVRDKPQDVGREVRALLDRMRENEAQVHNAQTFCEILLDHCGSTLKILDPEIGQAELIKAVAFERAKIHGISEELAKNVGSWDLCRGTAPPP